MDTNLKNSNLKTIISNSLCRVVFYTLLFLSSVYLLGKLLIPIMAGVIFATALLPQYKRGILSKIKSPSRRAQVLVFLFLFACMLPAFAALYSGFSKAIQAIDEHEITFSVDMKNSSAFKNSISDWISKRPALETVLSHLPFERQDLVLIASNAILKLKDGILDFVKNTFSQIPEFVISVIILLLTMYFYFLDRHSIKNWINSLPLLRNIEKSALKKTFSDVCNSIIYASVFSGIVQASIIAAGSLVIGFGNSLLLGLITFFCSFIPVIGAGVVSLTVLLLILTDGTWTHFFIFSVFGFIASISDNFTRPVFMQSRAKTHPLVTFVGALAGVQLFGMYGLFIGPVWIATVLKLAAMQQKNKSTIVNLEDIADKP